MRMVLAAVMVVGAYTSAWAWGEEGHSIIGEVAQHRVSATTQVGISSLLGQGWSLAAVASWADDERARDKTTTNWHFVDIPSATTTYDATRDCKADAVFGDCIIAAIEREKKIVACGGLPVTDRMRALKFLVHFVGDLHQPLHAIEDARGGNEIDVTIVTRQGINGNAPFNTSLHSVWDAALIQKTTWSWGGYVDRLENGWLKTIDAAAIASGMPVAWAEESHNEAIKLIQSLPANRVLDDKYRQDHLDLLDRKLGEGGIRLAKVLNDAFATATCP